MDLNQIYVIGHVNPDTDSIASAIGYAWLLRERDGTNAVAARAGAINPQTSWVLKIRWAGSTASAYRCFTAILICDAAIGYSFT